ncbi:MAG: hypothetical protein AAFP19_20605 [Bacteroidota bacterium]
MKTVKRLVFLLNSDRKYRIKNKGSRKWLSLLLFSTCLLITCFSSAKGQQVYKGYIVTSANDTLKGEIWFGLKEYIPNHTKMIYFSQSEEKVDRYRAKKLKSVQFEDQSGQTRYFVTKSFLDKKNVLIEQLVEGSVGLYVWKKIYKKELDPRLITSPNSHVSYLYLGREEQYKDIYYLQVNGKFHKLEVGNTMMLEQISPLFRKCPEVADKILYDHYNREEVAKMVEEYNACMEE